MKKSIEYSFSNLTTKVVLYPISFLASILISRYLGAEDKGVYAYILILCSFLIPIFSFGISGGMKYYVSNKKYTIKEVWWSALLFGISLGLINALLLLILWRFNFLGASAEGLSLYQIIFVGLILISNGVYFFMTRIGMGASYFHTINSLELSKSVLNPLVMILLVYLLALRINGVLYAMLAINTLMALGISIRLFLLSKPNFRLNFLFIKKSLLYGIKGWLGDMAVRANVRLDQLILGGIVSSKSLGIYSVGVTLAEMLWIIPDSIGPVLFNRIAAEKNIDLKISMTERVNRILFLCSFLISVIWICFCYFVVIPLGYGKEFLGSIVPFVILIPGALFYIPAKVTTKLLSGTGLVLQTSKATAIGSAVSILLYLTLIPNFEIIGAAVASTIGYLFVSIFCIYYSKISYGLSLKNLFIFRRSDVIWLKSLSLNPLNRFKRS